MEWLTLKAPAKINLYFEVSRRLPSGFHEICSLAVPIAIYDTVAVRQADSLTLKVEIPPEEKYRRLFAGMEIPEDDSNLVLRAARLLRERAGIRSGSASGYSSARGAREETCRDGESPRFFGADIILEKRIPSQAGMGGGSSDAAAALILLNELWDVRLTREELAELGAELGSDVPLFLSGFPVICRGRGEKLEAVPGGAGFPPLPLVIVKPPVGCSTPAVYRQCVPNEAADERILERMVSNWKSGKIREMASGLVNRLLEPACRVSPEIGKVFEMFREVPDPCLGVSMTGSGSACFGICRDCAHAEETAKFLEKYRFGTVFAVETHMSELVSCVGSCPEF